MKMNTRIYPGRLLPVNNGPKRGIIAGLLFVCALLTGCIGWGTSKQTESSLRSAGSLQERLSDRGLTAIRLSPECPAESAEGQPITDGIYLSWRLFEEDFDEEGRLAARFTVLCNGAPVPGAEDLAECCLILPEAPEGAAFSVQGSTDARIHNGLRSEAVPAAETPYYAFALCRPAAQTMPDGSVTEYYANDMSVGDADGDGVQELVVKWLPDNERDNSEDGYTGTTFIDTYTLDRVQGTVRLLSRIDLGANIRSGDHYTPFLVWDLNGDGRAELAVKTADGTTIYYSEDGTDRALRQAEDQDHVGACAAGDLSVSATGCEYDYRSSVGRIPEGREYFTVFDIGRGVVLDTVDYTPARGSIKSWGDNYGNRSERYLAAIACLDGEHPFAVMCRGYYGRTALTAYGMEDTDGDGVGDRIYTLWGYDSGTDRTVQGQGGHNLAVGDVDGDGRDEILYCSAAFDDDGKLMYTTGLGHGDVMLMSDIVPWNEGQEIFAVHEEHNMEYQVEIHDAATGQILMGYKVADTDVGRGLVADIDPYHDGAEFWASKGPDGEGGGTWDTVDSSVLSTEGSGTENVSVLSRGSSPSMDMPIYWDGDLTAELLDHRYDSGQKRCEGLYIEKWDPDSCSCVTLMETAEALSSNRTKGNVGLVADLLGDWREEFVARNAEDPTVVRIYTTTFETSHTLPCQMENLQYRESVARQNVGYNQRGYAEELPSCAAG